ncbi:MAG: CPBP family intramembrane metalloprotease [Proteobacteria bacterium]|nr:CPBP family intramembrane metalloprotease [Cystobacterineae bacterium]MCL2314248.1 CPBP family intramembrane metalloprotease [Pseudomonadota bacterium]
MRRSLLPQVVVLGLVLFFVLSIFLQSLNLVFGACFVQVFVFFCIPWVASRLAQEAPVKALGFLAVSPKKLAAGALLGVVGYFAVVLPLMYWVKHLVPASWEKAFDGRALFAGLSGIELWLMVAVVVCVAPLCEEVFFRGFIQPKFIRRWGAPMGFLVTSVFFSFIHMDPVGFLARLALGLLFGWLAYTGGSLWVSISAHISYNLLVYILFFYFESNPSSEVLLLGQGVLFLWLALGVGGMGALFWVLKFSPPSFEELPAQESRILSKSTHTSPLLFWSILRPWLLAAGGSCVLLVAADYRGVALNMFDAIIAPLPRVINPQLQEEMQRMRALRQQARKGQVELRSYFEFRQQLFLQSSSSEPSSSP